MESYGTGPSQNHRLQVAHRSAGDETYHAAREGPYRPGEFRLYCHLEPSNVAERCELLIQCKTESAHAKTSLVSQDLKQSIKAFMTKTPAQYKPMPKL